MMATQSPKFSTQQIMWIVIGALMPGLVMQASIYGLGVLWNAAICVGFCLAFEWFCLTALSKPNKSNFVTDGSAILSGLLIALCLPPFTHVALLALAALGAIGLAKYAYGGLGQNLFNPAMVGYAVVLVSFPALLTDWHPNQQIDGLSGATLLSEFKFRQGITADEFYAAHELSLADNQAIMLSFAAGGLVLMFLRLIAWRIPAALCGTLLIIATIGDDGGSSFSLGSFWFHLTAGGFGLALFFVFTDPVTHPHHHKHQILFGVIAAFIVYFIRAFGVYPDGIAFAVLLCNCLTAFFNQATVKQKNANEPTTADGES